MLIAVVALLFRVTYPTGIFDFVLSLNRWALRVMAYVALMTDAYPPFRLDMGPDEPPVAIRPPPRLVRARCGRLRMPVRGRHRCGGPGPGPRFDPCTGIT